MSQSSKKLYSVQDLEIVETYLRGLRPKYHRKDPRYKEELAAFELDRKKLNEALKWAGDNAKSTKIKTIDDQFSDPLLIAAKLTEYAKPDLETLLAAILYPCARPLENRARDVERLAYIREKFGEKVHRLVEGTLDFRALNLPFRPEGMTDEEWREERGKFHKMSKAVGRDAQGWPAVFRGVQLLLTGWKEIDNPGTFEPGTTKRMIFNINEVFGPMLYELGYAELRTDLKNVGFRLSRYDEFVRVSRKINWSLDLEDREEILKRAVYHIADKLGWARPEKLDIPDTVLYSSPQFTAEYRPKSAFSAYEKSIDKNIPVEKLGDLHGIRIIIKRSALGDMADADPDIAHPFFVVQCRDVHKHLATAFGRYAKKKIPEDAEERSREQLKRIDPKFMQAELKRLAAEEPRHLDPARLKDPAYVAWENEHYPNFEDSCFNDYLDCAKNPGSARFLKESAIWIPIPAKDGTVRLNRVEVQIVDEYSHEHNQRGSAAHTAYKNGYFPDDSGIPDMEQVFVFDKNNRLVNISRNPTVQGFIDAAGETCSEVQLHDPFGGPLPAGMTLGPSSPLRGGLKVMPVHAAPKAF